MLYCSFMWVTLAGDLSRLQLLRKNAEVYVFRSITVVYKRKDRL